MADFKIEIPIDVQGNVGGAKGKSPATKELEKLNKNTLSLNKSMILNIDVLDVLSSLMGDILKVISPLFKLLSIMFLLIFLPLMPLFKALVSGLAKLTSAIAKITGPGKAEKFVQEKGVPIASIIAGILIAVGAAILFAVGGWVLVLLGAITAIITVFWEDIANYFIDAWNNLILPMWEFLGRQIMAVWEEIILPAWLFLKDVGLWIWEQILLPAWNFLKDVGVWIWDIISKPFRWLADKVAGIINWFGNIGGKVGRFLGFADGGVVPGPKGQAQLAVVHGGETIIPSGRGTTGSLIININNPIVRQSSDIKMLANEVSRVLQRQMSGRISSGG